MTDDYPCPGCGCMPGEGRTPGCYDLEGCGYMMGPHIKGGQGRTDQSIKDSGEWLTWIILLCIVSGIVITIVSVFR